jgi:tetratricopeptide (TPR) repeat protein
MEDALAWIDYGNLLWGSGKPGLAKIAYQRSLVLRTRAADAQNNLAVVEINDLGLENWFAANDALALWKKALVWEPGNSAALFNVGHLFNYYRLFKSARPYFERVLRKVQIGEVFDELAVSSQGIGEWEQSAAYRKKAEEAGLPTDRFTARFLEAGGASGPECASLVLKFPGVADLKGFEKSSFTRLKQRCP